MLLPFLSRLTVITGGVAVVVPRVVDELATRLDVAMSPADRGIWAMAGSGVFIVLFSLGSKHAEEVLRACKGFVALPTLG